MTVELLESGASGLVALHDGNRTFTRGELRTASRRAAAFLRTLGLGRGDIVAVWLPDGAVWLQLFFAAAQLGMLMVPVSARLKPQEALHAVRNAKARALVVPQTFLQFDYVGAAKEIKALSITVQHIVEVAQFGGFEWNTFKPYSRHEGRDTDLLCAFAAAGTNGASKLAVHTAGGITRYAHVLARLNDIREKDVVLCALPLDGVLGFAHVMAALVSGAVCMLMPAFIAEAAAAAIEQHRITHFLGLEAMMEQVLEAGDYSLASWRRGGFPEYVGRGHRVTAQAYESWGVRLAALHGMSECLTLPVTCDQEGNARQGSGSGGLLICDEIALRIADPVSGVLLPDGHQGELQLRGHNVMAGYLHDPRATSRAFAPGGWFKTGKLASAEGGAFRVVARAEESPNSRDWLDCLEI